MPKHTNNIYESTPTSALIGLIHRSAKAIARKNYWQGRLQHSKTHALAIISEKERIGQSDLLRMLDIRPSTLSDMLGELEQNNFIIRERNPHDKRNYIISVTSTGRVMVNEYANLRDEIADEIFYGFSKAELRSLRSLLTKLVTQLEDEQNAKGQNKARLPALYFGLEGYVPDSK